jgi:predicted TIM-barrel fold metal-dependent hydrolase
MTRTPRQLDRPSFLRQLTNHEHEAQAYSEIDQRVIAATRETLCKVAANRGVPLIRLSGERAATAAGLRALNKEWGAEFYKVPESAERDDDEADRVFSGKELVIDVQTHYLAPHSQAVFPADWLRDLLRSVMPAWWRDLEEKKAWDISYYLTNIFLRAETGIAILTSSPGTTELCPLFNDEMHATRLLVEGLAGTGRLFNHAVVHADLPREFASMEEMRDRYRPIGWKVYTMGAMEETGWTRPWFLDDERVGFPFLERARALGVKLVCVHKGLSQLAPNGSPRDIGPAARAFPDINFVVYHSGYEFPVGDIPGEGPYTEASADIGINRLIHSVRSSGIGHHSNVYAELGATWFSLIRRPIEAAHVLGKLIQTLGEDNVIWGTDTIWYGSAQPLIDAFRTFQIPEHLCEQFGYRPLTARVKEKILSLNAARVYNIDVETMRIAVRNDDLAWARQTITEFKTKPFSGVR